MASVPAVSFTAATSNRRGSEKESIKKREDLKRQTLSEPGGAVSVMGYVTSDKAQKKKKGLGWRGGGEPLLHGQQITKNGAPAFGNGVSIPPRRRTMA